MLHDMFRDPLPGWSTDTVFAEMEAIVARNQNEGCGGDNSFTPDLWQAAQAIVRSFRVIRDQCRWFP